MLTVPTPTGRRLAVELYGAEHGRPVMWFHGIPGSRLGARVLHDAALERGVMLIVPDRPGYGCSEPLEGDRVSAWPEDVRAIANTLHLDRCSLLGVSGGFQYVAATARALPDLVDHVGVVSALGPVGVPGVLAGIDWRLRLLRELSLRQPKFARVWLSSLGRSDPHRVLKRQMRLVHDVDRNILKRPEQYSARVDDLLEAARQGTAAAQDEGELYVRPWGFELEELEMPFHLWQGELDRTHPPTMARYLEAALPDATLHWRAGAGGFFFLEDFGSVLDELLA